MCNISQDIQLDNILSSYVSSCHLQPSSVEEVGNIYPIIHCISDIYWINKSERFWTFIKGNIFKRQVQLLQSYHKLLFFMDNHHRKSRISERYMVPEIVTMILFCKLCIFSWVLISTWRLNVNQNMNCTE